MPDKQFNLRVKAEIENVPVVAKFLEEAMLYYGVDEALIFDVNVAVDEACTNIIQHAYPAEKGPIDISCNKTESKLAVIIKDYGKPFDQTSLPDPDVTAGLEERRPGGLGVYLMRKLMDELCYEYKDGCETLTMIKYVKA
jgi:serine/threonine-protein kinase RsbW